MRNFSGLLLKMDSVKGILPFSIIMRFEAGKLVEHWGVPDRLALMEQLGMKPPPRFIMKLLSLLHR
jgi:hypothetical protein